MRSKVLPLVVGGMVLLGIAIGIYYRQQASEAVPVAQAPVAQVSPVASPLPGASGSVAMTAATPSAAPDLTVDANGLSKTTVVVNSTQGVIKFKFYPQEAPETVKRMIVLISQGFYNGLAFHRVVPGFVVQGGDPQGNGTGGSGVRLKAEFNKRRHTDGTVAMARAADPDSADSQFYITLGPQPHLDGSYTVFGQVVEGMDAVRRIKVGDKMTSVTLQ